MFWAMMYMLVFGGSADDELSFFPAEKEIRKTIADPQRREQIIAILEEVRSAERVLVDAYTNREADLTALSLRYDADVEEFREVIAGVEQTRRDVQAAWLESRFGLKKHLTRSEWEALYGR